jgi:outer membrane protein TolC
VPSLRDVVALARERAPEVVMGAATVETARSGLVGARRAPVGNPYLEVTGERSLSGSWGSTAVTGMLWVPLEIAGQRASRIDEANANIELHRLSLGLSRARAAADAVRAYGMAVVAQERARVLEQLLEFSRAESALYEGRFQSGDATLRDTRLAEVELGRYGVLLDETRADIAAALSELGRLTGVAYSAGPGGALYPPRMDTGPGAADGTPSVQVSRAEARYFERSKERLRREGSAGALSAIAMGGRGELGDVRLGAGLGYALPVLQRNQGEQARAEAESGRARTEGHVKERAFRTRIAGLREELSLVRRAIERLDAEAEPAAVATLDAATEMQRVGKTDLFSVLTSRRDLALLRLRRIDLAAREWGIASDLVAITGKTP